VPYKSVERIGSITPYSIELLLRAFSNTKNHSSQVRPSAINMGTIGVSLYEAGRQGQVATSSESGVYGDIEVPVVPVAEEMEFCFCRWCFAFLRWFD
jgi:hypothetical protein